MRKIFNVFVVLLAFFLASCSKTEDEKKLVVATSADFPPYAFETENGKYDGIDIEISKELAKRLNLKLEIQNMPFNSIINSVASGKADIGINGITVIEERKRNVNFTKPYDRSSLAIVVKQGSKIKNIDDLYDTKATYKVGVQATATGGLYFKNDIANRKLSSTISEYQSWLDAVPELLANKIDCIIMDMEQAKNFVKKSDGLRILQTKYVEEEYAIVVNKDKLKLLDGINMALENMKLDGTIENIRKKYVK